MRAPVETLRRYLPTAILLLAVTMLPLTAAPRAQAADAGLVLEALGVLRERYVDPVDPVSLLNGALRGIRAAVSAAGASVDLLDITAQQPEATFRARFSEALRAASGRISSTNLAYMAVRGMTATFNDSHTAFITPEQHRERQLRQQRQAAFSGIGVVLMPREGRFYVRDVIPRTPAQVGGVQAFDRIVRINDVPTAGLPVDQVAGLIRGPTNTTVSLVLDRPTRADHVTLSVVRAPIQVPAVFQARLLEDGVGYIQLYQFISRTGADFRRALDQLLGGGMRALVLDLRGNGGGFLHELTATLNTLLPSGRPIYQETTRGGQIRTVRTAGAPRLPSSVPLIVLVDESSASAAELLSAALQEQGRATLVGAKTGGAVEASVLIDLSDGSALSVTILRLASGAGRRLEAVGVSPDIAVLLAVADLDRGRDTQFQRAVEIARQRLGLSATPKPVAAPVRPAPVR